LILFFITFNKEEQDIKEFKPDNVLETTQRTDLQRNTMGDQTLLEVRKMDCCKKKSMLAEISNTAGPHGSYLRSSYCTPFATLEKAGSHEASSCASHIPVMFVLQST